VNEVEVLYDGMLVAKFARPCLHDYWAILNGDIRGWTVYDPINHERVVVGGATTHILNIKPREYYAAAELAIAMLDEWL